MKVAFTIASKNYASMVGVLAESFKRHHPDGHFIFVLCDRCDGYPLESYVGGAEVLEISTLSIPSINTFIYRYSIMELNTAVKPFVFEYLFRTRNYDHVVYLDPDIWIHRPLDQVYSALERADIVLTPHLRQPFSDGAHPADINILQSGTYNLGFIALKRGLVADRLLAWWSEKLNIDCVVDIPRGLFVDQKWIDLVPGFYPTHAILYDPTCNVAYWNLHERQLSFSNPGGYLVCNEPLTFFHFSGYSPFVPGQLSKHQNRHALRDNLPLQKLCDDYRLALLDNGYEVTSKWPYSFATLSNAVSLPLRHVRTVVQWALRNNVEIPDPFEEPDRFCSFLVGRHREGLSLLGALLEARADVSAAYPRAKQDLDDPGFRNWLATSGVAEEGIGGLLKFESSERAGRVAEGFALLRKKQRFDVFMHFKKMWTNPDVFREFARWFDLYGVRELGIDPGYSTAFNKAYEKIGQILNLYFLDEGLQRAFPILEAGGDCKKCGEWLRKNGYSVDEASLFFEFATASAGLIGRMRFLYQHLGAARVPASIFMVRERLKEMRGPPSARSIRAWLATSECPDIVDQYKVAVDRGKRLGTLDILRLWRISAGRSFNALGKIKRGSNGSSRQAKVINLAGYFTAPSGMGESGRSMQRTLAHIAATLQECVLPHPMAQVAVPVEPAFLGWPSASATASIAVANADTVQGVRNILPAHFWTKKNIGYWVWETDELPKKFRQAADLYSEIWTPSEFSAGAIRRTVDKEVVVVPHTLDLKSISEARESRARLALPENATLFGFMFDPKSVIERKNVRGLIEAFRKAFGPSDDAYLIIKINGRAGENFEYNWIKAKLQDHRVLFLERTFSRSDAFDLMASLDVYASLHRSEGFGLTCAEAMAMGKPVIASNYSGNLQFMTIDNSVLVPTRVIETDRPYGAYPAGVRWGDPDIEAAAEAMRKMLDRDYRSHMGMRGKTDVLKRLDLGRIADVVDGRLGIGAPPESVAAVGIRTA